MAEIKNTFLWLNSAPGRFGNTYHINPLRPSSLQCLCPGGRMAYIHFIVSHPLNNNFFIWVCVLFAYGKGY